jgi:hypothetical protein
VRCMQGLVGKLSTGRALLDFAPARAPN